MKVAVGPGTALIVAATLLAYWPALGAGFVWDDTEHILANANLRDRAGLVRIWLEPRSLPQYYPLVHTTFWLEYRAWKTDAIGYHAVNVLLHSLNALLFWRLLRRLDVPGAGLAALVFALHPVHVESVAWVTERKNLLSGSFYLASFACLLDATGIGRAPSGNVRRRWVTAFLLYVLALLSKTVAASLPAAFLLAAWWKGRPLRPLLKNLTPFFATGLVLGLHTAWLERTHVGASGAEWALSSPERLGIAGRAVWFYLWKLAWPTDLAFIYPRWAPELGVIACGAVVAALAVLWMLAARRDRIGRAPLAAALFFGGTLFPALGFFNVFPMRFSFVADHFQYLASLSPIALAAAAMTVAVRRLAPIRLAWIAQSAMVILLASTLGWLTHRRASIYEDQESLWRDTLARNPACWLCSNNLGGFLMSHGRTDEAITALQQAVAQRPAYFEARINLATALRRQHRTPEAEHQLREAVRHAPHQVEAVHELGRFLAIQGRLAEATPHLERAVTLAPGNAAASQDLGRALALQGRFEEAIAPLTVGLAVAPDDPETHRELGFVLARAGRHAAAADKYREVLRMVPDSQAAREGLEDALARSRARR